MAFYHCLLLDLDGTLLDFNASENAAIRDALSHFGLPSDDAAVEQYREINNALWRKLEQGGIRQEKLVVQRFETLLEQLGAQGDAVQMNDYYLTQLSLGAQVMPGVADTLQELAEAATLVVVSNGVERVQDGRLERSGLRPLMDGVFISSKVGAAKPSRKIFDAALHSLGIEQRSKVLVVGDSLTTDVAGGRAAGLDVCWCNYGGAALPEGTAAPKYEIHSFEELMPIVLEKEELENVGNPQRRHQI